MKPILSKRKKWTMRIAKIVSYISLLFTGIILVEQMVIISILFGLIEHRQDLNFEILKSLTHLKVILIWDSFLLFLFMWHIDRTLKTVLLWIGLNLLGSSLFNIIREFLLSFSLKFYNYRYEATAIEKNQDSGILFFFLCFIFVCYIFVVLKRFFREKEFLFLNEE